MVSRADCGRPGERQRWNLVCGASAERFGIRLGPKQSEALRPKQCGIQHPWRINPRCNTAPPTPASPLPRTAWLCSGASDFGTPFHLKCVELPAAVHFQAPT